MAIDVEAPFPGTVLEIMVHVGDTVKEDEELLIIEAMKMHNPVVAPSGGRVKEIKVREQDKVNTSQVLLILE